MSIMKTLALTALLALASLPGPASAVELEFSIQDVATIRAYFGETSNRQRDRPKGRQGLPPGIARNLARGKPLPPGIAKQYLPADLSAQLPPPPDGFERVVLDGKILLVEIATQIIHDVLSDILS